MTLPIAPREKTFLGARYYVLGLIKEVMQKRGPKMGVSSQIIDWLELTHDLARAKLRGGSWRSEFHYEVVSLRLSGRLVGVVCVDSSLRVFSFLISKYHQMSLEARCAKDLVSVILIKNKALTISAFQ